MVIQNLTTREIIPAIIVMDTPRNNQVTLYATEVKILRDRNPEFEPNIIKKHETPVNGLEDQIIDMYAKGMSTRDIDDQIFIKGNPICRV